MLKHIKNTIKSLTELVKRQNFSEVTEINPFLAFKDIHKGESVFIIGNGPSLKPEDLDKIKDSRFFTIASNKIYKIFPQTSWRPNYYTIEDTGVCKSSKEDIKQQITCPIFAGDYLKEWLVGSNNPIFFHQIQRVQPPTLPNFSTNLLEGINCGGTVTYSMMQIAVWMGFTEIVLLGVDFHYKLPNELNEVSGFPGYKGYKADKEINASNYFVPDYFSETEVIFAPDMETSKCAYAAAKAFSEQSGALVIKNATRGGKLEVFERVDFESILSK